MKYIMILLFPILVASCASHVPKNQRNACLLLKERYDWQPAVSRSERKWNIPAHTILSIIYHESKFVPDAVPPRRKPASSFGFLEERISSAYGYAQALDGTWEEYKRRTQNYDAKRYDFRDSVDFIGWYLHRSVNQLGISNRNAYHLYLAYHQGNYGFKRKTYEKKPSIKRYARKVQDTAVNYMHQLNSCKNKLTYL